MTHRERVLRTFHYEWPDRIACDLMEGSVWRGLLDYFRKTEMLHTAVDVVNFLDTDFRWVRMRDVKNEQETDQHPGAPIVPDETLKQTVELARGPLEDAESSQDVMRHSWPDPGQWQPPDCRLARQLWPDHALVFMPGWKPLFWGACEAFGFENALVKMATQPQTFEAFIKQQHEYYMDILTRGLAAARGHCDICWLGDDFATQDSMMISPELWRRFVRPYLAEQVRVAREHDMYVLYHSCGAVRPVLEDLIDIGVNGLLVFQTSAAGMDAASIAREFGGRLVFYGGMDVQGVLSFGSVAQVRNSAKSNARAFADCGGYVLANSHSSVATIRPENILAMCETAREITSDIASFHPANAQGRNNPRA